MPRFPAQAILPALFLICALPVLLFLACNTPTGEVPDEVAHMVRMESLHYRNVIGHRGTRLDGAGAVVPEAGVTAHLSVVGAGFSLKPGTAVAQLGLTRERLAALDAMGWGDGPGFIGVTNTAVYAPLFYVPGAIGMQIAKWRGHGPWRTILAGRLANVATYLSIGLTALVLARRFQGVLFATLVLPMSLWLAASCNQDGLLIATAALAAALLTGGTIVAWWGAAAAIALIVVAKPLYLPLAGLVVVLLPIRGGMLPLRIAGLLVAAVPGVAWYLVGQHYAAVPFVRGMPFSPGPYWPGDPAVVFNVVDPAMQLRVLLHRPSLLLTLPIDFMWDQGDWMVWQIIGLLGVLSILLPGWLYVAWLWALGALLVAESVAAPVGGEGRQGALVCLGVLGCVVATVFAVFDGQYLSWTHTGWAAIEGMQGRYFIPLLPFLFMAIPALRVPAGSAWCWVLRLPTMAAGAIGVVIIPGLVVATYYLR